MTWSAPILAEWARYEAGEQQDPRQDDITIGPRDVQGHDVSRASAPIFIVVYELAAMGIARVAWHLRYFIIRHSRSHAVPKPSTRMAPMTAAAWDTLIRNALVFDGRRRPPRQQDLAL